MSAITNIPFPAPAKKTRAKREAGTYTTTDSAVVAFQKVNGSAVTRVLTALSERSNYRQRAMTIPDLMAACQLKERATEKAIAALIEQGFCSRVQGGVIYTQPGKANVRANGVANACANDRTSVKSKITVQDEESQAPKELEGIGRKEDVVPGLQETREADGQPQPQLDAAGETEGQTPDGVASGEADPTLNPFTASKTVTGNGETDNVTDSEKVPPGRTPREAMAVLAGAGLQDTWRGWVRLTGIKRVSQELHALQWAEWVTGGQAEELKTHVTALIEAGTYNMPWAALKHRMTRPAGPAPLPAVEVERKTNFKPGQRVRYPDGSEATVLSVLSRGIATDHPDSPDVPLGRLRTLEIL
ncbi:hypothetical protein [Deinococcus humi]|uniref:Uncharacterized protein n=1 Tax=Deinococcus humi TaxID=662880 RepID=A0A7W8JVJ3_9DEIO|nr:hypothetical protein [Deinococcus humi]MBB5364025.1 hypothetical protein [Deinococcus humi]GGO32628.1 hypothetical protein GCM10008949_30450 [Deinococcus humi]